MESDVLNEVRECLIRSGLSKEETEELIDRLFLEKERNFARILIKISRSVDPEEMG